MHVFLLLYRVACGDGYRILCATGGDGCVQGGKTDANSVLLIEVIILQSV